MAILRSHTLTTTEDDVFSVTVDLGTYAAGDAIVIFAVKDSSTGDGPNLTVATGWNVVGSLGISDSGVRINCWIKENVSASETAPVITSSDVDTWSISTAVFKDVPTSSVIDVSLLDTASTPDSEYRRTASSLTSTLDNGLLVRYFFNSATGASKSPTMTFISNEPGLAEEIAVYTRQLGSAGATGTDFVDQGVNATSNFFSIVIKDGSSGNSIEPKFTPDVTVSTFNGAINTFYQPLGNETISGAVVDATTLLTTVNGQTITNGLQLRVNPASDLSDNLAAFKIQAESTTVYSAGAFIVDPSLSTGVYDFTGTDKAIAMTLHHLANREITRVKGETDFPVQVAVFDNLGEWVSWAIWGNESEKFLPTAQSGCVFIDVNNTEYFDQSAGTIDFTNIRHGAILTGRKKATSNLYMGSFTSMAPPVLTKGSVDSPINMRFIEKVGKSLGFQLVVRSGTFNAINGCYYIGDGSDDYYLGIDNQIISFGQNGFSGANRITDGFFGFKFNPTAGSNSIITNTTINSETPWRWDQTNTLGTQTYTGNILVKCKPLTIDTADYSETVFRECATVVQNGATLNNCLINNSLDGTGVVLGTGTYNNLEVRNCSVGIEVTTAGTLNITGNNITLTNNTTDIEFSGTGTLVIQTSIDKVPTTTTTGGGTIDLVITDVIYVVDGMTYTSDAITKFVVDTDTVSTFTISGFTPKEIEHIGSGSTTILGINNAKLVGTIINGTLGSGQYVDGSSTLVLGDGLNPSTNWVESGSGTDKYVTLTTSTIEVDLSGLRGLEFVDYVETGDYKTYIISSDVRLDIEGDLQIDPSKEKIVFERDAENSNTIAPLILGSTGILRIGKFQTINGVDIYSSGVAMQFIGDGGTNWSHNGFLILGGGHLIWNGGDIESFSTLTCRPDGQITINNGTIRNIGDMNIQLRLEISSPIHDALININDLSLDGLTNSTKILTEYSWNKAVFRMNNAQFQQKNGTHIPLALDDFDISKNINNLDFEFVNTVNATDRSHTITIQNVSNRVRYNMSSFAYGYVLVKRNISVDILDLSNSPITYSYYATDVDNGSRGVGPMFSLNGTQDDTDYKVYSSIGASGPLIENVIIEATRNVGSGVIIDDRTTNDSILFNIIGYTENITNYEPNLLGIGVLNDEVKLTPDLSITESNRVTVDAYTELETPEKFYDRAKSYLVDNYAGESATIVSRNGNVIDAGSYNITIDATAGSVFDITGNTITIKSSNFVGNINTSGTVTFLNGATFTGLINGLYEAEDGETIGESADGQIILCDFGGGSGSITLDGITPSEIRVTDGTDVTVNQVNNGKAPAGITTITETSGSITLSDDLVPSEFWTESTGEKTITFGYAGYETDLTGLKGLQQVDFFQAGDVVEYVIKGAKLNILGDLTFNATSERIVFSEMDVSGPRQFIVVDGGLTIFSQKTVNAVLTQFPRQLAIDFGEAPCGGNGSGECNFSVNGTGFLQLSGNYKFGRSANGTQGVRIGSYGEAYFMLINATVEDENTNTNTQVRLNSTSTLHEIEDCEFTGCSLTLGLESNFLVLSNLIIQNNNETVVVNQNVLDNLVTLRDLNSINAGVAFRFNSSGNTQHGKLINFNGGFSEFTYVNNDPADNNRLVCIKEFDFQPVDDSGASITSKYYAVDTDNGNRGPSYTENQSGKFYDCANDIVYTGTQSTGIVEYAYAFGNTDGTEDNRGENSDGDITWKWISYDKNITSITPSCAGQGTLIVKPILLPDSLTSESNKTTVDSYTELNTAQQFYDKAKAYLVDNYAGEANTIVSRNGDIIEAGAYNVVLDGTPNGNPAHTFSFDGSTITIRCSTFTSGINTTGTITVRDGALLNGGTF